MENRALDPYLQELLDLRVRALEKEMYAFQDREQDRRKHARPRVRLGRLVSGLSVGALDGEDKEYLQDLATRYGRMFDPQRVFLTWRDLSSAVAGSGGYLKSTEVTEAVDILRPWSVTVRAGMLVEGGLVGDLAVPKLSQRTTPIWLSTESSQVTPSTPTLSQVALSPKTVGDVVVFSRQLAVQTNADQFVGRELLRTIGGAIDQAVINGSGAAGQPLGLLGTSGVQAQSGTTLNAGVGTMKQKSAEANATDERISFLSTPSVRQLLETRERATGGGRFVWDEDKVADRPARVSTDVPAATMICGDWSLIYLGIWGEGFVLEVNPYDPVGFKTLTIQARMLVSCDVAVLHPPAFVVATSIT